MRRNWCFFRAFVHLPGHEDLSASEQGRLLNSTVVKYREAMSLARGGGVPGIGLKGSTLKKYWGYIRGFYGCYISSLWECSGRL